LRNAARFLLASKAILQAIILPAIALVWGTLVSKMSLAVIVKVPAAPELMLPAAIALGSDSGFNIKRLSALRVIKNLGLKPRASFP
jgi:hypothetical protein